MFLSLRSKPPARDPDQTGFRSWRSGLAAWSGSPLFFFVKLAADYADRRRWKPKLLKHRGKEEAEECRDRK